MKEEQVTVQISRAARATLIMAASSLGGTMNTPSEQDMSDAPVADISGLMTSVCKEVHQLRSKIRARSLYALPPELRLLILEHALQLGRPVHVRAPHIWYSKQVRNVLKVCREFRVEGMKILFGANTFVAAYVLYGDIDPSQLSAHMIRGHASISVPKQLPGMVQSPCALVKHLEVTTRFRSFQDIRNTRSSIDPTWSSTLFVNQIKALSKLYECGFTNLVDVHVRFDWYPLEPVEQQVFAQQILQIMNEAGPIHAKKFKLLCRAQFSRKLESAVPLC